MPRSASWRMLALEGARVRATRPWMRVVSRAMARGPPAMP